MRMLRKAFTILALTGSVARSLPAQQCAPGPLALVLSGGGVKGIAHLGILARLDAMGVRPDLIVGTSIGAIMGGLYASGYSAVQIDSIVRSVDLDALFSHRGPQVPHAWGGMRPLAMWEQGDHGFELQSPAVREAAANALLNTALLRGNLLARGNFDRLPIPFRAVATDLGNRHARVLGKGDLAEAVRASLAIPLVFTPLILEGRPLIDGGLSANVPVALARAWGARRVIVSDVGDHLVDTIPSTNPLAVAARLVDFLMLQPADSLGPDDAYIRPGVEGITPLDFSLATQERLRILGRTAADSVLPRVTCLPQGAVGAPPVPGVLGRIAFAGTDSAGQRQLLQLLSLAPGALDPSQLSRHLKELADGEPFETVWLHPTGEGDTVHFAPVLTRSARRLAGIGVSYDSELSGRLMVAGLDRRLGGSALEGFVVGSLSRYASRADGGVFRSFGTIGPRFVPSLRAGLRWDEIRRFDADGRELPSTEVRGAALRSGVEFVTNGEWTVALTGEWLRWRVRGEASSSVMGLGARLTHGAESSARHVHAEFLYAGDLQRTLLELSPTVPAGRSLVTPIARLGWGRGLPPHLQFALGGMEEGFPGLHLGERLGNREVLFGLKTMTPLHGPLSLRLMAGAGRSALDGDLFTAHDWVAGLRAGLGVETPIGPVRADIGHSTAGRWMVTARVGQWN